MNDDEVVVHQRIMHTLTQKARQDLERYRFRQFDEALDMLREGCLTEKELKKAAKMIAKFEGRPFTEDKGFKF